MSSKDTAIIIMSCFGASLLAAAAVGASTFWLLS